MQFVFLIRNNFIFIHVVYELADRFLGNIDTQLGASAFLASDTMSIADFCLLATIDPAEALEINMADYPNVNAWRNKLMQESFYTDMHNSYGETFEKMSASLG